MCLHVKKPVVVSGQCCCYRGSTPKLVADDSDFGILGVENFEYDLPFNQIMSCARGAPSMNLGVLLPGRIPGSQHTTIKCNNAEWPCFAAQDYPYSPPLVRFRTPNGRFQALLGFLHVCFYCSTRLIHLQWLQKWTSCVRDPVITMKGKLNVKNITQSKLRAAMNAQQTCKYILPWHCVGRTCSGGFLALSYSDGLSPRGASTYRWAGMLQFFTIISRS